MPKEKLIELYDSQGIDPEFLKEEAQKQGIKVKVPDNFYAQVSRMHEKKAPATKTEKEEIIDFGRELPKTKALYFDDWKKTRFKATLLAIKDNYIVLDQTAFYPTSGGQVHDQGMLYSKLLKGTVRETKVIEVFKQGNLIVHKSEPHMGIVELEEGEPVIGEINFERRKQLTQHHTSTHIINAAARKVLGHHINQASAKKDLNRAYLDITHYRQITEEEFLKIEEETNKTIKKEIRTSLKFVPRTKAEQKYGVHIYQGGAVPGREIRIVEIPGIDAQACGGTHLNNTAEAEQIRLIKTTKVKDGVVRIYFAAGKAAEEIINEENRILEGLSKELGVKKEYLPARAQELFEKWKKARKAVNKKTKIPLKELELTAKQKSRGRILDKLSEVLQTQQEYVLKTISRFKKEMEEYKEKIKKM